MEDSYPSRSSPQKVTEDEKEEADEDGWETALASSAMVVSQSLLLESYDVRSGPQKQPCSDEQ